MDIGYGVWDEEGSWQKYWGSLFLDWEGTMDL